jgi:hypothetical protein
MLLALRLVLGSGSRSVDAIEGHVGSNCTYHLGSQALAKNVVELLLGHFVATRRHVVKVCLYNMTV